MTKFLDSRGESQRVSGLLTTQTRSRYDRYLTYACEAGPAVVSAHDELVRHGSCSMSNDGYGSDPDVDRSYGPAPYDDGYICPCLWHQQMIERLEDDRLICHSWPGPTCGTCWRATCAWVSELENSCASGWTGLLSIQTFSCESVALFLGLRWSHMHGLVERLHRGAVSKGS